jgi:hypothetical protein
VDADAGDRSRSFDECVHRRRIISPRHIHLPGEERGTDERAQRDGSIHGGEDDRIAVGDSPPGCILRVQERPRCAGEIGDRSRTRRHAALVEEGRPGDED